LKLENRKLKVNSAQINERPTSNVQRRILNKVFYQFINRQSKAISSFDVQRSMFDVQKRQNPLGLIGYSQISLTSPKNQVFKIK